MQHLQSNFPLNLHVAFASNLSLNLHVICDLHICKQLVSQALQAFVTSSALCKQLISQDLYVIVTTHNLQLTTLMHVQNMLHKIKAPKDCSIGTQPQPVPDSTLGQVQSLATSIAAVAAEDGTTQNSITARVNQTLKLQKIAWLHDPFL
jgi:hypothetical protein